MKYYIEPKNSYTDSILGLYLSEKGLFNGYKSLEYKNEIIVNLLEVELNIVKFLENSKKYCGDKNIDLNLYSKDINNLVKKHQFPRNNKRKIKNLISKMKK